MFTRTWKGAAVLAVLGALACSTFAKNTTSPATKVITAGGWDGAGVGRERRTAVSQAGGGCTGEGDLEVVVPWWVRGLLG